LPEASPAPVTPGTERRRLGVLLAERSFRTGDFTLASGRKSNYYVDCRLTTMHAEGQALIGPVALDALRAVGLSPDRIGGLTMGADPIAYAVAGESFRRGTPIHAFSVRKEAKEHGRGRRIEGCFEPGARVVIVEDVITSGGSALRACEAVRDADGEVVAVLALVDRCEGGREAIEEAGYRVISLYTVDDLGAYAATGDSEPSHSG
jgi:orotate phosphoribosyltransferase